MDVSVVFCGGRQSGKSSLINSFVAKGVSKGNVPKPTVGLDYKFKRMDLSKSSGTHVVCVL
jgi:GTPase SAR1 family protein